MSDKTLPYYFPGEFSPPNRYDLNIAQWLLRKIHDVSSVTILIGKSKPGEMSIEQKVDLWDEYLSNLKSGQISVHTDENNSPLTSIYKTHESMPEEPFGIALPESITKNEDFQNHFNIFTGCSMIVTPPYDNKGVTKKMMSALSSSDFREFSTYLPTDMSISQKQDIFDKMKPETPPEQENDILTEKFWDMSMKNLYNKYKI